MQFMRFGQGEDCETDGADLRRGRKRKAPQDDVTLTTTEEQELCRPKLQWEDVAGDRHDFEECESLEVLGCLLTPSTLSAVRHRLARAEVVFWTNRSFFCSTLISWERKLREYVRKVRSVALYGSVLWTWGALVYAVVRAWEGRLLCYMMRLSWDREGETFGEWRKRHNRQARRILIEHGTEELPEAVLRRQFRWTSTAMLRFGRDLQRQTSRRGLASLEVWNKILAMIRNDTLPRQCQAMNPAACASVCFLLANDEEGWRLKQAVFGALDPDNAGEWRHSRPGRQSRWECAWVSLAGERWKERMLAGELRNFEEEFICAAMAMVGRVRELPLRAPQEAGDFREPLALGGAPRRAASHVSGVVGISRQGLRYASLEGEVCVCVCLGSRSAWIATASCSGPMAPGSCSTSVMRPRYFRLWTRLLCCGILGVGQGALERTG